MNKIIDFIEKNGWKEEEVEKGVRSWHKKDCCSIDICSDEIVFIDDTGDFLHLPVNLYAVIGALINFRQIAINYKA